ncbi:MAG TPA: hypothetical protein VLC49_12020 [Solirubrobacteraceae bacterium]|nr:hypothetical protein [Solirubrobacteraceae bacterium]
MSSANWSGQDLDQPLGIHSGLGGEHERLADRLDGYRDQDLVARLGRLAGARVSHVHDGLTEHIEHRLGEFKRIIRASDHDRERPLARAHVAARHRGVESIRPHLAGSPPSGHP